MASKPHVLIVGAGAIGSFYGAILKRAGATVSVVLRSEYDVVAERGFHIDSPLGDLSYRPDHLYRDGETQIDETENSRLSLSPSLNRHPCRKRNQKPSG